MSYSAPAWFHAFLSTSRLLGPADRGAGRAANLARILVVEDDYLVALETEQQLLDAGYEVIGIATTAEEAIDLAASEKPDLTVMDIRLAGLRDGIDAAIEISGKYGIPSIFATAHADDPTKKRAAAANARGWLQKPYSPSALIAAIKTALEL